MDRAVAEYLVGIGPGVVVSAIVITAYLVVIAVLEMLADITENMAWLTALVEDKSGHSR